jgi:hypothetical protein
MTVPRQWLSSDHVGIPTDATATMKTATEEQRNDVFCSVHAEVL